MWSPSSALSHLSEGAHQYMRLEPLFHSNCKICSHFLFCLSVCILPKHSQGQLDAATSATSNVGLSIPTGPMFGFHTFMSVNKWRLVVSIYFDTFASNIQFTPLFSCSLNESGVEHVKTQGGWYHPRQVEHSNMSSPLYSLLQMHHRWRDCWYDVCTDTSFLSCLGEWYETTVLDHFFSSM